MSGPVTFRELSYALLDVDEDAVLTTAWGNLAIFSTKGVAEQAASTSHSNLKIIPVWIVPEEKHNG